MAEAVEEVEGETDRQTGDRCSGDQVSMRDVIVVKEFLKHDRLLDDVPFQMTRQTSHARALLFSKREARKRPEAVESMAIPYSTPMLFAISTFSSSECGCPSSRWVRYRVWGN